MICKLSRAFFTLGFILLLVSSSFAGTKKVQFSIKNIAPQNGIWIMRPWIGIHDGNFPTFTLGQPASTGVQHIAEDGVTGDPANTLLPSNACSTTSTTFTYATPCMFDLFNSYPNHGPQASLGNPTPTGVTLSTTFELDPSNPNDQYLSYLVMIIPSNDAFWGTDTAHPIRLFTKGKFNGGHGPIHFFVFGSDILDAGTEANDEGASGQMDTAFLNQSVNGTGTHPDPADPNVHIHPGFIPGGPILLGHNGFGGTTNYFYNGDFKQTDGLGFCSHYQVAEVTIDVVPDISDLITDLDSLGLSNSLTSSLGSKLQSADDQFERGNTFGACSLLDAFSQQVHQQSGRGISSTDATQLLQETVTVSQNVGCN